MKLSPARIGLIILGTAVLGMGVFGLLVVQVTRVSELDATAEADHFDAVLDSLDLGPPRLTRDGSGAFTNSAVGAENSGTAPVRLGVLALRGSGFDLDKLGLTPGDIAQQGVGVILDASWPKGDRVLVWAE